RLRSPPYRPISSVSSTIGFFGSRFSRGGSLPSLTALARSGASLAFFAVLVSDFLSTSCSVDSASHPIRESAARPAPPRRKPSRLVRVVGRAASRFMAPPRAVLERDRQAGSSCGKKHHYYVVTGP